MARPRGSIADGLFAKPDQDTFDRGALRPHPALLASSYFTGPRFTILLSLSTMRVLARSHPPRSVGVESGFSVRCSRVDRPKEMRRRERGGLANGRRRFATRWRCVSPLACVSIRGCGAYAVKHLTGSAKRPEDGRAKVGRGAAPLPSVSCASVRGGDTVVESIAKEPVSGTQEDRPNCRASSLS